MSAHFGCVYEFNCPHGHRGGVGCTTDMCSTIKQAERDRVVAFFRELQAKERPHGERWMHWRDAADEVEGLR